MPERGFRGGRVTVGVTGPTRAQPDRVPSQRRRHVGRQAPPPSPRSGLCRTASGPGANSGVLGECPSQAPPWVFRDVGLTGHRAHLWLGPCPYAVVLGGPPPRLAHLARRSRTTKGGLLISGWLALLPGAPRRRPGPSPSWLRQGQPLARKAFDKWLDAGAWRAVARAPSPCLAPSLGPGTQGHMAGSEREPGPSIPAWWLRRPPPPEACCPALPAGAL